MLKKPLAMSVREVIWIVSFDLLLKLDPHVDVDNVIGYDPKSQLMKRRLDHESASWSKDLVGHVSSIHVVEWNISLFWVLNKFTQKKSIIYWFGMGCQWSNATWAEKIVLNKSLVGKERDKSFHLSSQFELRHQTFGFKSSRFLRILYQIDFFKFLLFFND